MYMGPMTYADTATTSGRGRGRTAVVACLVLTLLAGLVGATPAAASSQAERDAEVDYVTRINQIRVDNGLSPLVEDVELVAEARDWAATMARGGCGGALICHDPSLSDGITASWTRLGENVGYAGWGANGTLMDAFMASSGHRDNLLNPSYTRIGVGVVKKDGVQYVSHRFMAVTGETIPRWAPLSQSFIDVRFDHTFFAEIEWLAARGITTGFNDRTFQPAGAVTRQAMAAYLYRMAGSPAGPFKDPGYSDVGPTHLFRDEIWWLAATGITTGYLDGTFRPQGRVTRGAMAAFLYRSAGSPPGPFPAPPFSDISEAKAFYGEISWIASTGVAGGYSDGTYRQGQAVTRQAMAAFLRRFDAI
jgi:uncharacterized protein YkwD